MKKIIQIAILLLMSVFVQFSGVCSEQKEVAEKTIDVTGEQVERLIKAFPDMLTTFKNLNAQALASLVSGEGDVAALLGNMENIDKLNKFAQKHGFKDYINFTEVNMSVMSAFGFLQALKAKKQLIKQMKSLPPNMRSMLKGQFSIMDKQLAELKEKISTKTLKNVKENSKGIKLMLKNAQKRMIKNQQ